MSFSASRALDAAGVFGDISEVQFRVNPGGGAACAAAELTGDLGAGGGRMMYICSWNTPVK